MREMLEPAFDLVASAMKRAATARSVSIASLEAERNGLVELGDGKPSQLYDWERKEGAWTLTFRWRWYDQSKAFSIQPDMNIMTLQLMEGEVTVRKAEERYED